MITEIMLVEGVSDIQLISYFLQNVYGWKFQKDNRYKIKPLDEYEHIETLSKNENQLILCGVGGNGKFAHFVEQHHINDMIIEEEIATLMVVTDRDEDSNAKIGRIINNSFKNISVRADQWINNRITGSFGQPKNIITYLMIIPANESGALEKVIINALSDIVEESDLVHEVVRFIDYLKIGLVPELSKVNKANKATVGTFFSIRNPQNAMRSFGTFISKIDWSKSEYLKNLFLPFKYLGEEKPTEN